MAGLRGSLVERRRSEIKGGAVPKEYVPGVVKGLEEMMSSGVLAGFPVVDVVVRALLPTVCPRHPLCPRPLLCPRHLLCLRHSLPLFALHAGIVTTVPPLLCMLAS